MDKIKVVMIADLGVPGVTKSKMFGPLRMAGVFHLSMSPYCWMMASQLGDFKGDCKTHKIANFSFNGISGIRLTSINLNSCNFY